MEHGNWLSSQMKLVFHFLIFLYAFENLVAVLSGTGTGSNTLFSGQTLSVDQTLVSQNGIFEFGFVNSDLELDFYDYIAIWLVKSYGNPLDIDVVWTRSRDNENYLKDPVLNLSKNGDLVVIDRSENPGLILWSSNQVGGVTISPNLVLLDTGNLVLQDPTNSSRKFWQTFDHPTDTWLPGARLGLNLSLTSNGYSLRIDPSRTRGFIIQEISMHATYNGVFPNWMDIREDGHNFVNLFDSKEYSHYYVKIDSWNVYIFQWVNDSSDSNIVWSAPNSTCGVYSLCGPYSVCQISYDPPGSSCTCPFGFGPTSQQNWEMGFYNDGCTRNISLTCEINNDFYVDSFYSIYNISRFPDNPWSLAVKTEDECEASCLSNCLCTAYSYTYNKCRLWFGELFNTNIRSDGWGGYVMNIRIRNVVFRSKSRISQRGVRIIVMFSTGLLIISALGLIIFFLYKRMIFLNPSKVDNLVLYSYAQMKSITKKFSEKLGEGGFGCVFKGKLPNSRLVAVKKLKSVHYEEKQFRSEIQTIGIIQHVNLVRLLGFCAEGTKRLLIYEYMPNGSLNSHIFPKNSEILSWNTRYKIVLGIARGLAYLHEECRDCIVHCDIKPENILLDEFFCPKIADFGMAKLFGRDFSRVLTTMRGTIGYLAPEWISGQPVTQKIDVYSFGMKLFEIISGRRNAEKIKKRECTYFPLYAAIKINEGDVLCLLDERLEENGNLEEIDKACKVACWCIQDFEDHRPTMREVVHMLEGVLEIELSPIPKTLQNFVGIEIDSIYSVGE